ncbi:MAG: hypothetical protein PHV11_03825 [Candidatus Bipolaricaulis sp.]|nr:hypothetical protein [Candidatus Bipolaricaulis sp.]
MAGFQQLNVTRKVDFTGAEQVGLGDGITRRGKVYYVLGGEGGTTGSDTSSGLSWSYPLKTITKALTLATDYDTIVCGANTDQGAYLEGATISITQDGLHLYGAMTSGNTWGLPNIHTHGTETLVEVDAHAVEIAYIGFHDQGAGCSLVIAATNNYWRTHVHDCYFGGNETALWGVIMGNTTAAGVGRGNTVDAPTTIVERCHFQGYVTGNIFFNCGYGSMVRNCTMYVYTAADGIRYYTDGTSRPIAFILDNRITSIDATNAVGITVTNTPTAGYLMIDGNKFINFADNNHCISKRTGYTGLNYLGVTAIAIT